MTEAKVFKYRTNLARKMSAPGGRSVEEALGAADSALAHHRDAAMEALGVILSRLEEACAARRQAEIYDGAAALLDLAGFFDTGPLHPAAFSLCEISDRGSVWDWPSVEVHVRAIRRILGGGCRETDETALLLDGLVSVRARLQNRSPARQN
ncbi:hypothetical protein GGQ87_000069 [Brevundimonas alba]|uniref:Chemotaxis protein CheE n=1 Tax=Brevundimonas alba TaxID=74314 RepID=A0A7X5YIH1_9CAUL|nr:chemotaxis protein CheE [Brevundimonas alba]NJC39811.1 hypothetical protein [Brevundimonas alba]